MESLSTEPALLWNWRTAQGQLKDMAARTLLLKLQAQGWIRLAGASRHPVRAGSGAGQLGPGGASGGGALAGVASAGCTRSTNVRAGASWKPRCTSTITWAIARQNLQYWVCDRQDRPLGCVVFGARQCAVRDQWIGPAPSGPADPQQHPLSHFPLGPGSVGQSYPQPGQPLHRYWQAKYGQPIWPGNLRGPPGALTFRIRDNQTGTLDYSVGFTFQLKAFPRFKPGADRNQPSLLLGG
jgi:hypothetical protein